MTLPPEDAERHIAASWQRNAAPWTAAVRARQIESRRLVTDAAIVDAIVQRRPQSVLDVGCGEGWLLRALMPQVPVRVGTDRVAALIESARTAGGGDFQVASYEDLAAGALARRFDVVACNFALIGDASVWPLFAAMPALLKGRGAFIVQTLHPHTACGDAPYIDGWREGSWAGCGDDFSDPPPWYFRTLASWLALFERHGLRLREMREPLHPQTGRPASVLFVAERG
ncbi:MAG: class I SAM-dependent methyltransferase [Solimonas sp.]